MEELLVGIMPTLPLPVLFALIGVALLVIMKGAEILVDQAVALSVRWGVPKMLIGATIVSIGTTLPEAAVSVMAAVRGNPGLALGNAVGSIIADTGAILGVAALIGRVPIDKRLVGRQSWIQAGSAALLILVALPYGRFSSALTEGGRIPQFVGFFFLGLLVLYLWRSITWSRNTPVAAEVDTLVTVEAGDNGRRALFALAKLGAGLAMVVIGSRFLVPAVEETALRLHIPDAIIAATLVAFGTSLPELVTAITAVRKGHGELAIGNVLGADVLNVLFVTGAAAAATPGGLQVPPPFYYLYFPSMAFVIIVLRFGISGTGGRLSKRFGAVLLGSYALTVVAGYIV